MNKRLRTPLCDLLGIDHPIFLAGMGSFGACTPPALVAAVSEAGGLGVIGGSGLTPDELAGQIRAVRQLTDKPFGVDIIVPEKTAAEGSMLRSDLRAQIERDYPEQWRFARDLKRMFGLDETVVMGDDRLATTPEVGRLLVDVVLEERVALFACALGAPAWMIPEAKARGVKVLGLVGNARHAVRQREAGVDMVVATGTEAGGHTGKISTMALVPQVVEAANPLPVLAAGGIGTGRQVAAALLLGAQGVWLGTAFLLAEECGIPAAAKSLIKNAASGDCEVHLTYTGKTMRGLTNAVTREWEKSGPAILPTPFQKILLDDLRYAAEQKGAVELDANPCGQIAGMLHRERPARAIVDDLVAETIEALDRAATFVR